MEQSSQNENVTRIENEFFEFFLNKISLENNLLSKALKENPNLQIKPNL
jgi:hypothetical protein